MKPQFLIFPCLLSDEDFMLISGIKDKLAKCHFELTLLCSLCAEVRYMKIDYIVNDLSELLSNRIEKGWRYNSYVLNLAIVKLDYVITLMNLDLHKEEQELLKELVQSYEVLSQILCNIYADYIDESF